MKCEKLCIISQNIILNNFSLCRLYLQTGSIGKSFIVQKLNCDINSILKIKL